MMRRVFLVIIATVLLAGCADNISPDTYSVGSVGQVNRTVAATVISVRLVNVAGKTGLGGTSGAAIGAIAGSSIGSSGRDGAVGAIVGAVAGGLAGAGMEAAASKQNGLEYVVETENGNMMTIVQGPTPAFIVGQKVLVLYGSPSRLIADPRAKG